MPVAQDHLATLRKAVGGVLRRHGFRVESRRTWSRGDDDSGWVLVAWTGDRWNTKQDAQASLDASVWPAGTREHYSALVGEEVAAFAAANSPVLGIGRDVAGDTGSDTFGVVADSSPEELAELVARAESYADALAVWADRMLDARVSRGLMRDDIAVAALLARHPHSPDLDPTLERLTASFQRDPRPIELHGFIACWRRVRGLAEVPLPEWSRYASGPYARGRIASPRDELLAGIGGAVDFRFADGSTRPPQPRDLPDAAVLARWRDQSRRGPLPDGVLTALPEWLPYAAWLELPAPQPQAAPASDRRRWWRR